MVIVSVAFCWSFLVKAGFGAGKIGVWIAVLILAMMKSSADEVLFRLSLFKLLKTSIGNDFIKTALIQAALFSLPYIVFGGIAAGAASFVFGLGLAYLTEKSESLVPSLICNFFVSLGIVGLPLLMNAPK